MKRRGFLQIFGAAIAAPVLPMVMAPAAQAATYNRFMYGLAVFHARTRAHISAKDLMFRLKITAAQAEAMIAEMTTDGFVTPMMGGKVRAVSNILKSDMWGVDRAAAQARKHRRQIARNLETAQRDAATSPDLSLMMAHLRDIATRYFALQTA